jgi:protein gp37
VDGRGRNIMSEKTKIAWCDSTGGPWLVCTEVSPGCANCYARDLAETRLGPIIRQAYKKAGFKDWKTHPVWGKDAPRVLTKGFWTGIHALNKKPWICNNCGFAAHTNDGCCPYGVECPSCKKYPVDFHRRRIFPSLIDWLDDMPAGIIDQDGNVLDPVKVLADFLDVVCQCDQVTWILCTKRLENWHDRLIGVQNYSSKNGNWQLSTWCAVQIRGTAPSRVVLLASVENQEQADKRIPELLRIPAACRGLSLEPLLGPVDVSHWCIKGGGGGLDWLIIGGESGNKARPCNVEWIRSLVAQGKAAGVPVFVKQLGANVHDTPKREGDDRIVILQHPKGGDPSEWPEDLRVQEWPVI